MTYYFNMYKNTLRLQIYDTGDYCQFQRYPFIFFDRVLCEDGVPITFRLKLIGHCAPGHVITNVVIAWHFLFVVLL